VVSGRPIPACELTAATCSGADAILIITAHSNVDYGLVVEHSDLILDTRNALAQFKSASIVKL